MKHELSAHEMRHRFSISQAHISGHKQTKMSHYKLSGKSENESSLHQADFLRVRYWPAPARALRRGQDASIPPNLHPCVVPRGSPTCTVHPPPRSTAEVVETRKGVISHHCNFCSRQFAKKNLIFLPSLFNFVPASRGHNVQWDVDDYPGYPIINSCHRHYGEAASATLPKDLLLFSVPL